MENINGKTIGRIKVWKAKKEKNIYTWLYEEPGRKPQLQGIGSNGILT